MREHPSAELVALQKGDATRARKMADDFGVPHAFTSVDEMLENTELDAVVVSSTPNMHYAQARQVLEAGKHLLIEKPMTIRADESRELMRLADARGLQVIVSCPWHYTAHGLRAQRMIREGQLGRIKMISVLMTNPIDRLLRGIDTTPTHGGEVYIQPREGSYNDPAIAGGGQIYCQVSHVAAYLSYLTGKRPAEVFARFDFDGSPNDLYDTLCIQMHAGPMASIATTAATPETDRTYEVRLYGSEGVLFLELWRGTMRFAPMRGEVHTFDDLPTDDIYPAQAPARNLVDVLTGQAENHSPGWLGSAAMDIIEAACGSARSQQNVAIAPLEQSAI
jgi:predicted dehydrogenase